MAYGGDAGLSGGSGNLTLGLWNGLAASGCHFDGHDLHLHDLNCEGLGTHVTVAVGDSTCNGHAWVLPLHLQTILPKSRQKYVSCTISGVQNMSTSFAVNELFSVMTPHYGLSGSHLILAN